MPYYLPNGLYQNITIVIPPGAVVKQKGLANVYSFHDTYGRKIDALRLRERERERERKSERE